MCTSYSWQLARGRLKTREWKTQDCTSRHQTARLENARVENVAPDFTRFYGRKTRDWKMRHQIVMDGKCETGKGETDKVWKAKQTRTWRKTFFIFSDSCVQFREEV